MKAPDLLQHWQEEYGNPSIQQRWNVALDIRDAARVEALLEMFPGLTRERLLSDLVHAALEDLTTGFPYVEGDSEVGRDEEGFPMYEDIGLTPRFLQLSRQHLDRMEQENNTCS